jgi:hypothetical protein
MPVTTAAEARKHLKKYFDGRKLTSGTVKDADRSVVDRVIIDKRTGRMRSVH